LEHFCQNIIFVLRQTNARPEQEKGDRNEAPPFGNLWHAVKEVQKLREYKAHGSEMRDCGLRHVVARVMPISKTNLVLEPSSCSAIRIY
jgi:hypothetical protein